MSLGQPAGESSWLLKHLPILLFVLSKAEVEVCGNAECSQCSSSRKRCAALQWCWSYICPGWSGTAGAISSMQRIEETECARVRTCAQQAAAGETLIPGAASLKGLELIASNWPAGECDKKASCEVIMMCSYLLCF